MEMRGCCVAWRENLQGLRQRNRRGHKDGEFQAGLSLAFPFPSQEEQMRQKAARARLTSSMLRTVRTIKSHGWECAFLERLLHTRGQELGALKTSTLLFSVSLVSFQVSTFLVTGDVILVSLQMPEGWERACLGWRAGAGSIASVDRRDTSVGSVHQKRTAGSVSPLCFIRWRWSCSLSTPWWQRTMPWMQRRRL